MPAAAAGAALLCCACFAVCACVGTRCCVQRSKKGLPEEQVWKYLLQALVGLSYIHSKRIIHRDMKSLNLFLDSKVGTGSQGARALYGSRIIKSCELRFWQAMH